MAIIVRLSRVSPKNPAPFWVEQCIKANTKDEYGNIFRVLTLYWKGDANHRMTPYAKTKGLKMRRSTRMGSNSLSHIGTMDHCGGSSQLPG